MNPEQRGSFRWDGTLNLGSMLAMVGIVVSIVAGSVKATSEISAIGQSVKAQGLSFTEQITGMRSDIVGLKSEVTDMKVSLARRDGESALIRDHEERIRRLERR